MALARRLETLSHAEYLEGEKVSEIKHEYVEGEVYAMSGASKTHGRIAMNLALALGNHLRGHPCEVFASDVKVFVEAADAFYYPDLVVVCDDPDRKDRYVFQHPKVIVEILSPSTELVDRGRKFTHFRTLPSLQEYVIVSQDRMQVEAYRRQDPHTWILRPCGDGDVVEIPSLGFSCPVAQLYERVDFTEAETTPVPEPEERPHRG